MDIVANIVGSLIGLGMCSLYHKRMLERKRKRKLEGYGIVSGEGDADLELGEGGSAGQEIGIIENEGKGEEEEAEVWDELGGEESVESEGDKKTPSSGSADE